MFPFFRDIDELILVCRSQNSRKYLAEAVSCYRAGAFRACIVSIWIAVVNDILDKLAELEDNGDANAKKVRQELRLKLQRDPIRPAQDFERDILDIMDRDFEFFTQQELFDLRRLREDRNRCAHPSFFLDGGEYTPSAELTRYHLRHAVEAVLSQQPVQGKAALDRLKMEIDSNTFPNEAGEVIQRYNSLGHPLHRAKDSLIRNFIIILSKDLIYRRDSIDRRGISSRVNALNAIRQLYPKIVDDILRSFLQEHAQRIGDDNLLALLHFVTYVAETWQYVPPVVADKIRVYLGSVTKDNLIPCVLFSLRIDTFKDKAQELVKRLTLEEMIQVIEAQPDTRLLDRVQFLCQQAQGIEDVDRLAHSCLIPYVNKAELKTSQVEQLLGQLNDQVLWRNSTSSSEVFSILLEKAALDSVRRENLIQRFSLTHVLDRRLTPVSRDDVPF